MYQRPLEVVLQVTDALSYFAFSPCVLFWIDSTAVSSQLTKLFS